MNTITTTTITTTPHLQDEKEKVSPKHQPAAIFWWVDPEPTGAIGWVVLDTLINNVSGGGIFVSPTATVQEVMDVAKNMTKKFTVTDPQIGGAKSGIRFSPSDPRAKGVIRRFIRDNKQLLQNIYITAGDIGSEDSWVEKCVQEETGLVTCQATLGRKYAEATNQDDLSFQLSKLILFPACDYFPLIEGAVGYGLARALEFVIQLKQQIFASKSNQEEKKQEDQNQKFRVVIQGFGAVGSSFALYLHKFNIADVVGISDKDGFVVAKPLETTEIKLPIETFLKDRALRKQKLINENAAEQTILECSKNLICNLNDSDFPDQKKQNQITENNEKTKKLLKKGNNKKKKVKSPTKKKEEITSNLPFKTVIYENGTSSEDRLKQFLNECKTINANVFSPCAVRYCITPPIANLLGDLKYEFIASGANNPLGNEDGGKTENIDGTVLQILQKHNICFPPDYVCNSGTAQLFHRGLSQKFDLNDQNKENLAQNVLDACAKPITNFLQEAWTLVTKNTPYYHLKFQLPYLIDGCLELTEKLLKHPRPFTATLISKEEKKICLSPTKHTEEEQKLSSNFILNQKQEYSKWGSSRYNLPPMAIPSPVPLEEKVKNLLDLFAETIDADKLKELLENCPNPLCYDGCLCLIYFYFDNLSCWAFVQYLF